MGDMVLMRTDPRYPDVAILELNNPPVNALGIRCRASLVEKVKNAAADPAVAAIIITAAPNATTFCGGADITEFSDNTLFLQEPTVFSVMDLLDDIEKPLIAAMPGGAYCGGLELALVCHYRICNSQFKCSFPEVNLGILPAAGGTQRLPRLIGLISSLSLILTGWPVRANEAKSMGIVDTVTDTVLEAALALAQKVKGRPVADRRLSSRPVPDIIDAAHLAFVKEQALAKLKKSARGFEAPLKCLDAVCASVSAGTFAAGTAVERRLGGELIASPQSAAQQYFFFAEKAARKIPDGETRVHGPLPARVGIVGAGTMGTGIAYCCLQAKMEVVVFDTSDAALKKCEAFVTKKLDNLIARGKISKAGSEATLRRLHCTQRMADLSSSDLVIEAVVEDMGVKRRVFSELDRLCAPHALLCTNTSALNVDEIASATQRPHLVAGMHFFSPAHVMPLLEVVRAARTAPATITAVVAVAALIHKTPVVVGNCDGFVGNRMLFPYVLEAAQLVLEGASPRQVDSALTRFGFRMGPFEMSDLAGVDVMWHIQRRHAGIPASAPYTPHFGLTDGLYKAGRLGQKAGKGWYAYPQGLKPVDDAAVAAIIADVAQRHSVPQTPPSDADIIERCVGALALEGLRVLEDRIAARAGDIDVVWVYGYGWPRFRGGPMYHAEHGMGLAVLQAVRGREFARTGLPHWRPCASLAQCVSAGGILPAATGKL